MGQDRSKDYRTGRAERSIPTAQPVDKHHGRLAALEEASERRRDSREQAVGTMGRQGHLQSGAATKPDDWETTKKTFELLERH